MLIEVLYMPGCPNHQPALHRLRKALQFEAVDVPIREIPVSDQMIHTGIQEEYLAQQLTLAPQTRLVLICRMVLVQM